MIELKPCPFCGAHPSFLAVHEIRGPVGFEYAYVACQLCGGAMIDGNPEHSPYDLMRHWNMRDERNAKYKGREYDRVSRKDKGYGWRG